MNIRHLHPDVIQFYQKKKPHGVFTRNRLQKVASLCVCLISILTSFVFQNHHFYLHDYHHTLNHQHHHTLIVVYFSLSKSTFIQYMIKKTGSPLICLCFVIVWTGFKSPIHKGIEDLVKECN